MKNAETTTLANIVRAACEEAHEIEQRADELFDEITSMSAEEVAEFLRANELTADETPPLCTLTELTELTTRHVNDDAQAPTLGTVINLRTPQDRRSTKSDVANVSPLKAAAKSGNSIRGAAHENRAVPNPIVPFATFDSDVGYVTLTEDNENVYVEVPPAVAPSTIAIGQEKYSLHSSTIGDEIFAIDILTAEEASRLVRMHKKAPDQYPATIEVRNQGGTRWIQLRICP